MWFTSSISLSPIELIKGKVALSSDEAYNRQWRRLLSWKLLSRAKQLVPPALWAQVEAALALGYEVLLRVQEAREVLVAHVSVTPEGVLIFQFRKGIYMRVRERRLCTLLRLLCANRPPHQKLFAIAA